MACRGEGGMSVFHKFDPRAFRESPSAAKAANPAKAASPEARADFNGFSSFSSFSVEPDPTAVTGSAARTRTAAENRSAARQATSAEWSVEDWQAYFDERAGIAEFDGGLPRAEAEARAFDCCVVRWLDLNPERSISGRCLGCGRAERPDDPLLPFGTEPGSHAWLHSACWPEWYRAREARARAALSSMGVRG